MNDIEESAHAVTKLSPILMFTVSPSPWESEEAEVDAEVWEEEEEEVFGVCVGAATSRAVTPTQVVRVTCLVTVTPPRVLVVVGECETEVSDEDEEEVVVESESESEEEEVVVVESESESEDEEEEEEASRMSVGAATSRAVIPTRVVRVTCLVTVTPL